MSSAGAARALTSKQEAFAQAVANGARLAEAYRSAYNASRMKPNTVHRRASEVAAESTVGARIEALRMELAERNLWSRERAVRALVEVIARPDKQGDVIAAVRELNAMHGFNAPLKIAPVGPDGQPMPLINVVVTYAA